MLIFLKKNKIIIVSFLSLLIFFSLLLTKVDLKLEKISNSLREKISVLAQEMPIYFFPRYPQRLRYLVDEISSATEDLVSLNEKLKSSLDQCDCKLAKSQCNSATTASICLPLPGLSQVFGDPCKNRGEIEEKQIKISEGIQELTFLENLLKKEMESGLKKEIESLLPDEAGELQSNLKKILQQNQEIISLAKKNYQLPEDCSVNQCSADCSAGSVSELDACFGVKGEQKPIELKFKLSAGLSDLDLGQIKIRNINLGLPKEIEFPKLGSLSPFKISREEFVIPIGQPQKIIRLQVPKPPSLTKPPSLSLSCPNFPKPPEKPEIWAVCKKARWCEQNCPGSDERCQGCKGVFVRGRGQTIYQMPNTDSCTGVINPNACNAFCVHTADSLHTRGSPRTFTKEQMKPYQALFDYFGFSIPDQCLCDKNDPNQASYSYGVGGGDSLGCQECQNVPIGGEEEEESSEFNDLNWFSKIFEKLSEFCQNLPYMKDEAGSPSPAAEGCFDPKRVVQTILDGCKPETYYACEKAGWCEDEQNCPGNEKCDACGHGFVRGRGHAIYGFPNVDSCTGPLLPHACSLFCVHFADSLYTTAKTFKKSEMMKYKALFDFFNVDIPDECHCNKKSRESQGYRFGVGGGDTLGCHNCIAISEYAFSGEPCSYLTPEESKVMACIELFKTIEQPISNSCYINPVETLKNKCEELKKKGKELPEKAYQLCSLVALYTGKLDIPSDYESGGGSKPYPGQKIYNYPSSILGCPASPPTIPKIHLPNITLPDIKLPEFKLKPFLHIKLPNFITEDLNFPSLELCNLNNCRNVFSQAFNFQWPVLSIPTVEIPDLPLGTVMGVPLPDLRLDPIAFPHIPFPIFRLPNLADLMSPELEYSGTNLPRPRINLKFSGFDLSAIFGYIITFIKNALGIPDFSLCISYDLNIAFPFKKIYPDFIFSLRGFPDIPEIPYCQDINQFCLNMKTKMAEVIAKVKKIENVFNNFIQNEIQSKLDQAAPLIQKELTKRIEEKLEPLIDEIRKEAGDQISQEKKEIVVRIDDIDIPPLDLDDIIKIKRKIPIPWPEELKKIQLTCDEAGYNQCRETVKAECNQKCQEKKVNRCNLAYLKCQALCQLENYSKKCDKEYAHCLSYDLPTIPLSCLSYEKEFPIKGPAFQSTSFTLETGMAECLRKSPTGGNPCPTNEFQNNLRALKLLKEEVEKTSQKIIKILQY